jgi:hypothetical protein
MRKYFIVIIALFSCFISVNIPSAYADNWLSRWQFGGSARYYAVGFNILSRGYVGLGYDGSSVYKDFWEYNPSTNYWTQKADFGGNARASAVGFSIGSKGYLATGRDLSAYVKDFWEYDPAENTWTQKADFAGDVRALAVGFSIGSKGYVGMGGDDNKNMKDFWEYDPETDVWSQKADFAGTARYGVVGFSIGSVGYIGTGYDGSTYYNDFWQYNPSTDSWTQKTNFSGSARYGAVGFSIGNLGYIGTGYNGSSVYKDLWVYDPSTDAWKLKTDFIGSARYNAVGFKIDNMGYLGTGYDNSSLYNDFWRYDPRDTLTFVDQTDVETNQIITSNTITVSWITSPAAISITGGTYSINGGTYTDEAGTINVNDTVTVHLLSSENFSATTSATLTIGSVSATFNVTTRGANTKPDQFTFIDQTLVEPDTVITSNTITVSGIEAPVIISITGGTYSINGGTYTSDSGTINNGDTVTVQVTSASTRITTTDAVLTIGGVSDTFSVKTRFVISDVDSGPCFIATAAFGSPLAGQVEILRKFRDKYLLTNSYGKKFVTWYYRNGPVAANWIKDKPPAKAMVQVALYPLIGFSWLLISGCLPSVTVIFLLSALLFLRLRPKKMEIL